MNILIAYGSTEGQTKKIAGFIETYFNDRGHYAEAWDSNRRMRGIDISSFDAVIIAGSVHQKVHQESLVSFVIAHRSQLIKLPTYLISVSLSIAFEGGEDEATQYVQDFTHYTEFEPDKITLVEGALKFEEYDFYMGQIVEHVVLEDRETITEDREFTDWDSLKDNLDEFSEYASSQVPSSTE